MNKNYYLFYRFSWEQKLTGNFSRDALRAVGLSEPTATVLVKAVGKAVGKAETKQSCRPTSATIRCLNLQ
jgi:hypothetical protein